jgi:hypothetical protein
MSRPALGSKSAGVKTQEIKLASSQEVRNRRILMQLKMSTSDFLVKYSLSLNIRVFYVQTSGGDTKA